MENIRAIIFVTILLSIACFFTGLNLGKTIENIDKNNIKPKIIIITPTPINLNLQKVTLEKCKKEIVLPDFIKITKNKSSDEANVSFNNQQIKIDCK